MGSSSSKKEEKPKPVEILRRSREAQLQNRIDAYNRNKTLAARRMPPFEDEICEATGALTLNTKSKTEILKANMDALDESGIPKKYLNRLGFINYNHYGALPWSAGENILLPAEYTARTHFLGIDCEMVGVSHLKDSALGRVSIVNESGFCIYDKFVRPDEVVTDYRTKYSGIRPEDLVNALSMDQALREVEDIVEGKVLVGHSIHNDLEVLKLQEHPAHMIRDTSLFFQSLLDTKHLPSLKSLIEHYFKIKIQDGEHSSIQDAQATLKLYLMYDSKWEQSLVDRRVKANLPSMVDTSDTMVAPPIDITLMNVCPREKDIFVDSKTIFVRENKVKEAYVSSEEYKDVQFRLLLEDLFRPLREGVTDAQFKGHGRGNTPSSRSGTIYSGIKISGKGKREGEVRGQMTLTVPIELNKLGVIDWEETKLFMTGQLLLVSPDKFKSVKFATIQWRPSKEMDTRTSIPLTVCFAKDGPSWTIGEDDRFQIMESIAFYEAYRHTLEFLQVVDLDSFPLKKYIVDAEMNPSLPKYLRGGKAVFDFGVFWKKSNGDPLLSHPDGVKAQPLDFNRWPTAEELKLDLSQYEAFQKAVTQEFTIIQGPPGTGKTFIGTQVVKFLLCNPHLLKSPVLIVSYTNHSLDQVLEGLLDFVTDYFCEGNVYKGHQRILRIGGGSKSAKVEPLTMFYKLQKEKDRKRQQQQRKLLTTNISKLAEFENGLTQGVLNLLQLPKAVLEQLAIRCKDLWSKWKSHWPSIVKNPVLWFGMTKTNPLRSKSPKWPILVLFGDLEFGGVLAASVSATMSKSTKLDPEAVRAFSLLAFPTSPLRQENYDARWTLYLYLIKHLQDIGNEMITKARHLDVILKEMEEQGVQSKKDFMASAMIVGMTTTGAVKHKKLVLNSFKSQVMLVEEAAHVLEAHVVASLTHHCQQMIMIGDHKQLRPMTADNSLAKNYKLEISLMERLVEKGKSQGYRNWIQLKLQHRMRPEIAGMVCPAIYEELHNHPSVYDYPRVHGCERNLFFIDHREEEEREFRSSSLINHHEANFFAKLCHYFVTKRGYDQSRITIIATYLDQKTLIVQKLKNLPSCANVRISTVDGYQGEENDIILLSLVRSNGAKNVGFLKTDNRVCVALSRARHGLFIMGNMSCLKTSSDTWKTINDILVASGNIGPALVLNCPLHGSKFPVSWADDFSKVTCKACARQDQIAVNPWPSVVINGTVPSPLDSAVKFGAIALSKTLSMPLPVATILPVPQVPVTMILPKINKPPFPLSHHLVPKPKPLGKLRCGHECPKAIDPQDIDLVKCTVIVEKTLACGHKLIAECYQAGNKLKCNQRSDQLPCGHKHNRKLNCSQLSEVKCLFTVPKALPCGHNTRGHCHLDESRINCLTKVPGCDHYPAILCYKKSTIFCDAPIQKELPCGHDQEANCNQSVSEIKCNTIVPKQLPCGHVLKRPCHLAVSQINCKRMVLVTPKCGHEYHRRCHESPKKGVKCWEIVPKQLPCGHLEKHPCYRPIKGIKCNRLVDKALPCGHEARVHCHQSVKKLVCTVPVSYTFPKCKHTTDIKCHESKSPKISCLLSSERTLDCGHRSSIPCHLANYKAFSEPPCLERCSRACLMGHPCPGDHECRSTCRTSKGKCHTCARLRNLNGSVDAVARVLGTFGI